MLLTVCPGHTQVQLQWGSYAKYHIFYTLLFLIFLFLYRKAIWLFSVQFINHNIASNFYRSLSCRKSFLSVSFFHFIHLCDTTMHARGSRPCTSVLPVPHLEMSLKALGLGTGIYKNHKHIKYTLKKKYGKSVHLEFTVFNMIWQYIQKMSPCWPIISCRSFSFYCSDFVTLWCHCAASAGMSLTTLHDSVSSDRRTFYIIQLCK